ncbi:arylsulfatase [bacterium]|nr:arylsulfatase [bacterium]
MKSIPNLLPFYLLLSLCFGPSAQATSTPNIIYVLVDDLGYGDLSCYGQATLSTPNLDKMASEGMKFTRHYTGSTVCAPSRCVLMTGLHTGHCRIRGNGPGALADDDVTVGTMMKKAGYQTGCFGKWGIGNPPPLDDPGNHGFDEFYGYVNMFHAHNFYPEFMVKNGEKVTTRNKLFSNWKQENERNPAREGYGVAEVRKDYAPTLIFNEMIQFVEKASEKPFFLYYALNIPHTNNEGGREERIGKNGMEVPSFGKFANKDWPAPEKGFARMIEIIDQDMGKIFLKLKQLGIDDNTVVMFASDNGPHQEGGHMSDFFNSNGDLRGIKRDLTDGGIRTPLLVRWPGVVKAGSKSSHLSAFQDLMPTVCEIVGVQSPKTDGISFLPTLVGKGKQMRHDHLYWEFNERGPAQAVIKGKWKAIYSKPRKAKEYQRELYDQKADPGEMKNIVEENEKVWNRMMKLFKADHIDQ